jgi:hypothetical protein
MFTEESMQLTKNVMGHAKRALQKVKYEGASFPVSLEMKGNAFFVAKSDDVSILAHGVIVGEDGVEYKIGTKK